MMDKQDLTHLFNQATVSLLGASEAGIKGELFDTIHEFFKDSSAWTEAITVPIVATTTEYPLTVQQGGRIIRLVGVWDSNSLPVAAFMPTVGTLKLVWPTNQAATYTALVVKNVVRPTREGDKNIPDAPDWLLQLYHSAILDGLLGKMMMQPQKSYTDSTLGTYHLRRFRDAIAMARVATARQNTVGAQAWSFPQNYRTRGQRGGVSVGNETRF